MSEKKLLEELGLTKREVMERLVERYIERGDDWRILENQIAERFCLRIDEMLNAVLQSAMDFEFQPVDEFGRPLGSRTTLSNAIRDRALRYMTAKVDAYGRRLSGSDAQTRIESIAEIAAKEVIEVEAKKQIRDAAEKAKENVMKEVMTYLSRVITQG